MSNYSPTLLGYKKGPAFMDRKEIVYGKWKIKNIPKDIDDSIVVNNIKHFFSKICAVEIPTSLICNCNCSYCYIREGFYKNKNISLSELDLLLKQVIDVFTFDGNLRIKHFSSWGAEPLCDLDNLSLMVDYAEKHDIIIGFSTNGTNTSDKAFNLLKRILTHNLKLKANNPGFQISIDGPERIQNKYRPLKGGSGSFEKVNSFILQIEELEEKHFNNSMLHSLCSTIPFDNIENDYLEAFKWFAEDCGYKSALQHELSPIRLENHVMYTPEMTEVFVKMANEIYKMILSFKRPYLDYYTTKLYYGSCRKNGRVLCSAGNTQISIDINGDIYLCHGYLSNYKIKPLGYMGNVFDRSVDYTGLISNIDKMNSSFLHKAVCMDCPLIQDGVPGFLCFACPPAFETLSGLPPQFDYFKCEAYKKSFPSWQKTINYFNQVKHSSSQ